MLRPVLESSSEHPALETPCRSANPPTEKQAINRLDPKSMYILESCMPSAYCEALNLVSLVRCSDGGVATSIHAWGRAAGENRKQWGLGPRYVLRQNDHGLEISCANRIMVGRSCSWALGCYSPRYGRSRRRPGGECSGRSP